MPGFDREGLDPAPPNRLDRQPQHFEIGRLAALAEMFDARLAELARAKRIGLALLHAEGRTVVAKFGGGTLLPALQEHPADRDGHFRAQAKLFAVRDR